MPATLHFSNSLDALADRLIGNLETVGTDPFETVSIATPASAVRDWLKVRIAEKQGVAANLAFPPLENMLWERLAERDRFRENPDDPDRLPARLLDSFSFQGLVLSRLRRDPPAPLRDYLASAQPEDAARRLCQMAGQLASLFREYEYNRVAERGFAGLAESWMKGEPNFERHLLRGDAPGARAQLAEVRALEGWQMDIYRSLFERGGLRDQWGEAVKTYRYTLPQYAHMALGNPCVPTDAGRVYHLFGLSNISPFHRDLIGQLADEEKLGVGAARFEIYALNPCAEYWEDVLTLRERRARGLRALTAQPVSAERVAATRLRDEEIAAGEVADADDENGLLSLFGKPGRETIKLWCQLTGHDFHEDFREPPRETLLMAVQTSVLRRAGPLPARVAPDDSLRFRSAADPRGELEGVRAEIAEALAKDPTLRPEDLAIIPADPATVLPVLRAVFAGEDRLPGNVPILFPDGGPTEESPFLQGFRALLALADAEVTRDTLLGLLENAAVRRAAGLDDLPTGAVADFLEAAGFVRGWERPADTEGGDSSLAAALERATLSLALEGDDEAALENGLADLPRPVPGLWSRLDREEADALLGWLETLRESIRPLRAGSHRPFAEWAVLLRHLRDNFLKPDATHSTDVRDAFELRRFLDEMEAWSGWAWGESADAETADILLVSTLFADRFRQTDTTGRTNFLRGGVRTGPLSALRGLPFRRVWVTGLTTDFPSTGDSMPLDLRAFRRLPGESDPTARDLYALLEVIVSCTENLTLSWARRGPDGRDRLPSRALSGLMAWLENDILPSRETFDTPFGFTPFDIVKPPPPARQGTETIAYAAEPALKPFYKFTDVDRFLRNPVQFTTRRTLSWDDESALEEQEAGVSADLFIDKHEEGRMVLDPCLRAELLAPGSAVVTFERLWTNLRNGGHLPPPPWNDLEERRLRAALRQRLDSEITALRDFTETTGLRFVGSLRLGPQGVERAVPPVLNLPAFDLAPWGVDLSLGGVLPWFFHGADGWALLADNSRHLFPAYLIQLCSVTMGEDAGMPREFAGQGFLIMREEKGGLTASPLPSIIDTTATAGTERDAAREILRDLLGDFARALRNDGHLDDVPLDIIEKILENGEAPATSADWNDAITTRRRQAEEARYERVNRPERMRRALDPALPPEIAALIARRVQPYLSWKNRLLARSKKFRAHEDAT